MSEPRISDEMFETLAAHALSSPHGSILVAEARRARSNEILPPITLSKTVPKCYELAVFFLENYDVMPNWTLRDIADRLAERIHEGIEDDLSDLVAGGKIREILVGRAGPALPAPPGIERKEQGR